jgi:TPR repeat protein
MAAAASSSVTPMAEAEVSPDRDTAKKDSAKDAAKSATDTKPDDARIPDYKPSAALLRAQQYIRGRGVAQNCEQGLLYLRAATEKNDPGAAIQMAALYSSGLCVKQDRVMAYRWFNSAHELQPANMWIQKNMDQLWAQMTSQERRLAGY